MENISKHMGGKILLPIFRSSRSLYKYRLLSRIVKVLSASGTMLIRGERYHFIKKIMKSNAQKIAVIGGSGKAGKYLVQQLVYEGYSVRALVRDPVRFQVNNPAIEMV